MTPLSGNVLGAHQKIDKVARRNLERLMPGAQFPCINEIIHFEGHNGPDAIKRKSPAVDEPWHYIQPFDREDTQLIKLISANYDALRLALQNNDMTRASFEAAWLAHAIVDGLTPAHHYPYEEKLVELRGGQGIETRTTFKEKMLFPGETLWAQVSNNWQFWGSKGVFSTHLAFEWGVSTLIMPLRLTNSLPSAADITSFTKLGVEDWFRSIAQDVAKMELYDDFYKRGWTTKLGRRVRRELAPTLARAVSLIWYSALKESTVTGVKAA